MSGLVVVGSANVDLQAEVEHLPAAGETVMGGLLRTSPGGKGANQAVAARRLGGSPRLLCAVGDDVHGDAILAALAAEGLDPDDVCRVAGVATGVALIVVARDGENSIVITPGANAELTAEDVLAVEGSWFGAGSVLALQLEVPVATVLVAAQAARRSGATVVLNCAPMPADPETVRELLASVDVLVVNETEASAWVPGPRVPDVRGWQGVATRLRSLGPDVVVVTLGSQGAVAATAGGAFHQPPFPVEATDTTGAGDVFCAALCVELEAGSSLPAAIRRACAAGALATTVPGAQAGAPTADAVDRLLSTAEVG